MSDDLRERMYSESEIRSAWDITSPKDSCPFHMTRFWRVLKKEDTPPLPPLPERPIKLTVTCEKLTSAIHNHPLKAQTTDGLIEFADLIIQAAVSRAKEEMREELLAAEKRGYCAGSDAVWKATGKERHE